MLHARYGDAALVTFTVILNTSFEAPADSKVVAASVRAEAASIRAARSRRLWGCSRCLALRACRVSPAQNEDTPAQ